MIRTSILAAGLAASLACARSNGAPAEPEAPRGAVGQGADAAGDTLRVPFGRSASHEASGVRATFLTLVADSRCPIDAACVWEGDAEVRVRLQRGTASSDTTLHWSARPSLGLHAVTIDGWRVTFFGLTPFPQASAPPVANDARTLWLLVRRDE